MSSSRRRPLASLTVAFVAALAPALASCSEDGDPSGGGGDGGDVGDGARPDASGAAGDPDGTPGGDPDGWPGGGPDGSGILDAPAGIDAAPPDAAAPRVEGPYDVLSESGLYADIATHTVAGDVMEFEPEFKLWSDGALKRRWIHIPPGRLINSDNMDRWGFPPGTTAWKEFRDPVSGKRLETRIIQRLSNGSFYFASFVWNDDDSEARVDRTLAPDPPVDIPAGCSRCDDPPCDRFPPGCHVVPQSNRCNECHGGETHKLLGFSAVQLSHDGSGLTLTELADRGLLTRPPPDGVTYPVPGTRIERSALGYLHANCGHCHTSSAGQNGCYSLTNSPGGTGLELRVLTGATEVPSTRTWQSAVDQPLRYWVDPARGNYTATDLGELITLRIAPGDASRSAIWYRMSVREWGQVQPHDDHQQMPYFATDEVDEAGLAAVELWINSLR